MSKIKILKASYLYPLYIDNLYKNSSLLCEQNYLDQYNSIMEDMFGWSDVWKRSLDKTNDYEVMEVILTNEKIQKKWAAENNYIVNNDNWLLEILFHQISFFNPDVFFAFDNSFLTSSIIKKIKNQFPFIKLVIGYDGISLNNIERFSEFDIVLSCLESSANFYSKNSNNKIKGYFLPLGFDKKVLNNITPLTTKTSFSFIGSLVRGEGYHNKRIEDLSKLANLSPIQIFSSGLGEPYEPYRYLQRNRLKNLQIREFWQVYSIGRKTKPPVYGLKMYELLASSKITFNSHLDNANGKAANMRLFEATGVGSCLITDYMDNLTDFFDIDNEVVTYKSIPECIDKVKNLLRDEKLRNKIAIAGQAKTLKNHSFEDRIVDFSYLIKTYF